mmetsp:Transcript_6053/g.14661  ORF Transcript_6053/g.14661 Transcript_6053/m.14661 type:complete len:479 (+) Transcript_6053:155-1591(+)
MDRSHVRNWRISTGTGIQTPHFQLQSVGKGHRDVVLHIEAPVLPQRRALAFQGEELEVWDKRRERGLHLEEGELTPNAGPRPKAERNPRVAGRCRPPLSAREEPGRVKLVWVIPPFRGPAENKRGAYQEGVGLDADPHQVVLLNGRPPKDRRRRVQAEGLAHDGLEVREPLQLSRGRDPPAERAQLLAQRRLRLGVGRQHGQRGRERRRGRVAAGGDHVVDRPLDLVDSDRRPGLVPCFQHRAEEVVAWRRPAGDGPPPLVDQGFLKLHHIFHGFPDIRFGSRLEQPPQVEGVVDGGIPYRLCRPAELACEPVLPPLPAERRVELRKVVRERRLPDDVEGEALRLEVDAHAPAERLGPGAQPPVPELGGELGHDRLGALARGAAREAPHRGGAVAGVEPPACENDPLRQIGALGLRGAKAGLPQRVWQAEAVGDEALLVLAASFHGHLGDQMRVVQEPSVRREKLEPDGRAILPRPKK